VGDNLSPRYKKLFEIGSRIYDLLSLGDEYDHYDEIALIFDELRDYTIFHFGFEEKLMKKYGYEGYENHKIEHDFFVKKLQRLEKTDFDNKQTESLMQMITFVADWITGHILKTDAKYKDFFNARGIR
jgi:hemerythrin